MKTNTTLIPIGLLTGITLSYLALTSCDGGSSDDTNTDPSAPAITADFAIYGAMAGDYELTTLNRTLIGTSDDGITFDVSQYDRFIVYIPPTSGVIYFDAFGLDNTFLNSQPGAEFMHYSNNLNPTGSSWDVTDSHPEGAPDGLTISNLAGEDAYYGFSTLGAGTLTVHTTQN